ncbi:stress response NST1 [Olea europaea subsp. europaea]|uniref:Stress response NST1 n=1 Tax=Olea europaea subsp. europaea TaxID=158383 RepID=A0A8S0RS73_OLEEU|nr:stress response NST1 [Olea europaea subsp. europaea]
MCILCEIQKWSRRVATMLPWLVIPLIGLWALSQLLPPAFRFEITSPRLACVFVLLVTLFWYEILMPKLSAWRVRRNARLRERKRIEAIEIQKLRKTATRRCRNCLTPYRDQNPGGGKFTCLYCGHISKRPVLDLPESLDLGSSGILKYLVGKGGTVFNGNVWSENGNWVGGPFDGKSSYWKKNGGEYVGGENHCLTENSYSHIVIFTCKVLTAFLLSIVWLWRKIFRVSSSRDDTSTDAELIRLLDKQGENGGNFHESRGEKARRKAEEKRQARLEKELLEEEERKQREEVARMVEERRRLRDEKLDKNECGKEPASEKDRNRKKEAEKKHQERKKERDRGSSKSNSDVEESEKKVSKESTRNKKIDGDSCEEHRTVSENVKSHSVDVGHGFKGATMNSHNRGTAGTRYLDRMKGTFLSSSRALTGGGFLGKSANKSTVSSEHRPNASIDHVQGSAYRKDVLQPEWVSGRSNVNGNDKNVYPLVVTAPLPCPAPKKSWQQLFTRSSAVSAPSNPNVISRPNVKSQTEVWSPPQLFDGPVNFGQLPPSTLPSRPFGSINNSRCHPSFSEAIFPRIGKAPDQLLPEESEIFEDPCYIPDPVSLLGPVSESLDNFDLDLGFVTDTVLEEPCAVKTTLASSEVTKPSPIQSPLSRSRLSEERIGSSSFAPSAPKAQDNSNNANDNGTWQMWNSSPLGQAGKDLVGGPVSWLLPPELSRPKEDIMHSVPQKTMASLFKHDEQIHAGTHSSQNNILGNFQNSRTYDGSVPSNFDGPWLPQTLYGPTSGGENQILLNPREKSGHNGIIYGSSSDYTAKQQFDLSGANSWEKKERMGDPAGNSSTSRPHIGGLYSTSDEQHLWSYD